MPGSSSCTYRRPADLATATFSKSPSRGIVISRVGIVLAGPVKSPMLKLKPQPPAKVPTLNYRHHFHAGNFADVMKHALWLQLLRRLAGAASPLQVIDTHAGAGLYDLEDTMARRSKEAEAGVGRLMADET